MGSPSWRRRSFSGGGWERSSTGSSGGLIRLVGLRGFDRRRKILRAENRKTRHSRSILSPIYRNHLFVGCAVISRQRRDQAFRRDTTYSAYSRCNRRECVNYERCPVDL